MGLRRGCRPAADEHDAVAAQEDLRQAPLAPLLAPARSLHLHKLRRLACTPGSER